MEVESMQIFIIQLPRCTFSPKLWWCISCVCSTLNSASCDTASGNYGQGNFFGTLPVAENLVLNIILIMIHIHRHEFHKKKVMVYKFVVRTIYFILYVNFFWRGHGWGETARCMISKTCPLVPEFCLVLLLWPLYLWHPQCFQHTLENKITALA